MEDDFEKREEARRGRPSSKLGLDPDAALRQATARRPASWTLKRGSASVLVAVTQRKEDERSTCASPRRSDAARTRPAHDAALPAAPRAERAGLANAAFGLIGDRVVVVSERPAAGLDDEEVEQIDPPSRRRRRHLRRPAREGVRREARLGPQGRRLTCVSTAADDRTSCRRSRVRRRRVRRPVRPATARRRWTPSHERHGRPVLRRALAPTGRDRPQAPPPHDDARRRPVYDLLDAPLERPHGPELSSARASATTPTTACPGGRDRPSPEHLRHVRPRPRRSSSST